MQSLLDAVEIDALPEDARDWLQRVLWRDAMFFGGADCKVTLLLRVVYESANGGSALTLPIMRGVSNACMRKSGPTRGSSCSTRWIKSILSDCTRHWLT